MTDETKQKQQALQHRCCELISNTTELMKDISSGEPGSFANSIDLLCDATEVVVSARLLQLALVADADPKGDDFDSVLDAVLNT